MSVWGQASGSVCAVKVEAVRHTPFAIPLRRPLALAGLQLRERRGFLVEVLCDTGEIGLGEASPHPAATRGALETVRAALASAALCGVGFSSAAEIFDWSARVGDAVARAALQAALCDALARSRRQRVAQLIGVPAGERVRVNALIGETDPDAAADAARRAVTDGFRCVKLKAGGGDAAVLVRRIRAVRDTVGPDVAIRLDANGAWGVDEATRIIGRLSDCHLEYFEQPVADLAAMAAVRKATGAVLAADEIVTDASSVRLIAAARAADVIVVKPALLGLGVSLSVMRAAAESGLDVVVTSLLDTSVGISAALQLAALPTACERPAGLATASLLATDLALHPLVPERGAIALPAAPGLGIDLDRDALERCSWQGAHL